MPAARRRVGRYEIVRQIGSGGMAIVYLARQVTLERDVALKELNSFGEGTTEMAERFMRESRLAGSLNHPNIVTVHEYLEEAGIPYIAMEYIPRGSLRPYMGRLSLAQFAGVMEGVLAGLAHAEVHGIVHRDLKPENLMVTGDGRVKIADFGIAKATQSAGTAAFLTAAGTAIGTPSYMAPEQAMGQEVGMWTDLYSVGVMAWEHVVGRVPFGDGGALWILMRHVSEAIPPAVEINHDVDPDVSNWIEGLLVKDPRERTRNAVTAWEELEEIVISKLGPRWRRDARLPSPTEVLDTPRPLTPAPFESRQAPTPPPVGADEDTPTNEVASGYMTFVRPPEPPERPESGAVAESAASEPPEQRESGAVAESEAQSSLVREPADGAEPTPELTAERASPAGTRREAELPGFETADPAEAAPQADRSSAETLESRRERSAQSPVEPPQARADSRDRSEDDSYVTFGSAPEPETPAELAGPSRSATGVESESEPGHAGAEPRARRTTSPSGAESSAAGSLSDVYVTFQASHDSAPVERAATADSEPPAQPIAPAQVDVDSSADRTAAEPQPAAGGEVAVEPQPAAAGEVAAEPEPAAEGDQAAQPELSAASPSGTMQAAAATTQEGAHQPPVDTGSGQHERARPTTARRGRVKVLPVALGLAGIVAAAIVGFALAPSSGGSPEPTRAPFVGSASAGPLEVSFPGTWRPQSPTAIQSVTMKNQIVVARVNPQGGRLVMGTTTTTDPSLLPDTLVGAGAPKRRVVTLGHMQFYRYLGVASPDGGTPENLYALPTTGGTVIGVCILQSGGARFASDCERVVGSLRLTAGSVIGLGPDATLAAGLTSAVGKLNSVLSSAGRRLDAATRPGAQATAANDLAAGYEQAASSVRQLDHVPTAVAAIASLADALRNEGAAYRALARAAGHNDRRGYDAARSSISSATRKVSAASRQFVRLGYDLH